MVERGKARACAGAFLTTLWSRFSGDADRQFPISEQQAHVTSAPIDLDRLLNRMDGIVRAAGEIASRFFRDGAERWTKTDDSPVTEADIAVDRFLFDALPPLVDGAGWLSEETADTEDRRSRRHVFVVDPIDGTRAFIEGKPEWVISVALVEDGAPVAGVVYNPSDKVCYSAARGLGARRDGERLRVADSASIAGLRIGAPTTLFSQLRAHGAEPGKWRYALANRLVQVAGGGLDAALARPRSHDWDIAAAHVILEEAGARLVSFDGSVPSYNRAGTRHDGLIAAAPMRVRAIAAALEPALSAAAHS